MGLKGHGGNASSAMKYSSQPHFARARVVIRSLDTAGSAVLDASLLRAMRYLWIPGRDSTCRLERERKGTRMLNVERRVSAAPGCVDL